MTEPEHARVLAWGTQLRTVHTRLRAALDVARESLRDGADATGARDLLVYCRGFCAALDGHHASEDAALFPEIARRHPRLVPVIEKLRQDHSMIAHLVTSLEHALDADEPPTSLERHLDGIGAIMESHFRYEESQLLTVLDALDLQDEPARVLGPL